MLNAQRDRREGGQVIVLAAVAMGGLLMFSALAVDGGYGLAERRAAQNAADFAALAGARIVAHKVGNDLSTGTDANVRAAIDNAAQANGATVQFGSPTGPRYVDDAGNLLGYVGSGMPEAAAGVFVQEATRSWTPFIAGALTGGDWEASGAATAKGGFAAGGPGQGVFPLGVASAFFDAHPVPCAGEISNDPNDPCYPQYLTDGNLNVPGGFGWLKFGCDGYGLGQEAPANAGGCKNSLTFLREQIGPPGNSYGCCTEVGQPGSPDHIGSGPGNMASADCDYYIDNKVTVIVPVWDIAGGTGQGGWYHIIGYSGFQLTGCHGAKNVSGVWRQAMFNGPVTTEASGPDFRALGTQLVR